MDSVINYIMARLIILPGILVGLSFHEFGHAWVSYKLGDPTPKAQGRVSLNPGAHLDIIGFIALLLLGFGWGKPVEINPAYYRHRRRDEMLVAFAGVFNNLIIAIATAAVMKLLYVLAPEFIASRTGSVIWQILIGMLQINIVLMLFNLIPLPPLDGFGIVTQIFKLDRYSWYPRFYQLGPMFLLLIIVFNLTDIILTPQVSWLYNFITGLFF
ncbi:MAG: site-2 protease family protein [Anaerovoracaceae bacterium]|nr:site-2 protease family protein [Bacillota bacterium]MDY2671339.1 site-2 protease family protein [Anaerovoracaceae bacterium]